MSEIRSVESIKAHAREALDRLNAHGTPPVNPCPPDTDGHKTWAAEFYACDMARASKRAQVVQAEVSA